MALPSGRGLVNTDRDAGERDVADFHSGHDTPARLRAEQPLHQVVEGLCGLPDGVDVMVEAQPRLQRGLKMETQTYLGEERKEFGRRLNVFMSRRGLETQPSHPVTSVLLHCISLTCLSVSDLLPTDISDCLNSLVQSRPADTAAWHGGGSEPASYMLASIKITI